MPNLDLSSELSMNYNSGMAPSYSDLAKMAITRIAHFRVFTSQPN